jgi:hypothetical protein
MLSSTKSLTSFSFSLLHSASPCSSLKGDASLARADGTTPLCVAAHAGHSPALLRLLAHHHPAAVNTPRPDGATPLYYAAFAGNPEVVRTLLGESFFGFLLSPTDRHLDNIRALTCGALSSTTTCCVACPYPPLPPPSPLSHTTPTQNCMPTRQSSFRAQRRCKLRSFVVIKRLSPS